MTQIQWTSQFPKIVELSHHKAEALILAVPEGFGDTSIKSGKKTPAIVKAATAAFQALDQALKECISKEVALNEDIFSGKIGEILILPTYGQITARYIILIGLGKPDAVKALQIRRLSAQAMLTVQKLKLKTAALIWDDPNWGGLEAPDTLRLLSEGALLGGYRFTKRKGTFKKQGADETKSQSKPLEKFFIISTTPRAAMSDEESKNSLHWAEVLAKNVNLARDWVNDSANYVTPAFLKAQAEEIEGLECVILDQAQIRERGMGAFTLVAQGSEQPSYLVHLIYKPKKKAKKKIALVGKGVTFDSGGLSLKPSGSMELMKMDMGGAAAVLAVLKSLAELDDLPVEVHGVLPLCENMPSGGSSKPGDIVTAMNGKTIEVNNTDAEGRLILCDALTYIQREADPDELVDLATLTGACIVALGKTAAGIMGTHEGLSSRIQKAGEHAGEKFWPLPLYEEYQSFLKSDVADLINSGAKGEAGSSAGGMFLKEFVDEGRAWVHLDIAGPAWTSKEIPETPKGGTAFGVRTLMYYLYGLFE